MRPDPALYHKPPHVLLGTLLVAFAQLGLLLAAARTLGQAALAPLRLRDLSRPERACLHLAVGLALLGYGSFGLDALGLLRGDWFTALLFVCAAPIIGRIGCSG